MKRTTIILSCLFALFCPGVISAQINYERLLRSAQEPRNWLTYSGDYKGWRFSGLKQINATNVGRLAVQWVFQTGILGKFETTPLVIDGMMYVTGQDNLACAPGEQGWGALRALDPRDGKMKWEFKYYSAPWSGALSTAGGLVFAGDMEGYLIALDAVTGKELWHLQTGSSIYASPMAYAIDGKQYVVIPSGTALIALALPENRER